MRDEHTADGVVADREAHGVSANQRQVGSDRTEASKSGVALIEGAATSGELEREGAVGACSQIEEAHGGQLAEATGDLANLGVDGVEVGVNAKTNEVVEHVLRTGLAVGHAPVVVQPHGAAALVARMHEHEFSRVRAMPAKRFRSIDRSGR